MIVVITYSKWKSFLLQIYLLNKQDKTVILNKGIRVLYDELILRLTALNKNLFLAKAFSGNIKQKNLTVIPLFKLK